MLPGQIESDHSRKLSTSMMQTIPKIEFPFSSHLPKHSHNGSVFDSALDKTSHLLNGLLI